MTPYPVYNLTLHKSYYDKGFFNLGVDIEKFVRPDSGPISIILGDSKACIEGHVSRTANRNGTPRIFGGIKLQHWVQSHFTLKDIINVYILSPEKILLRKPKTDHCYG